MATQTIPTAGNDAAGKPRTRILRRAQPAISTLAKVYPLLLIYSLFVPAGLDIFIGEIRLFPYRLLLVLSIPFLLAELQRRPFKPLVTDYFIVFSAAWIASMVIYHMGIGEGLEAAGREAVDLTLGYFIMRIFVRDTAHLRWLLKMTMPVLAFTAAVLAFESLTFRLTFANWFPLENVAAYALYQERMGLLRAWGPFPHPILGGFIMASFLPLFAMYKDKLSVAIVGCAAACAAFFSLSSAAILLLLVGAGLLAYWAFNIQQTGRPNWLFLITPAVAALTVIQLFVGGGAGGFVMRYLSLTPQTAMYRRLIWEYGTESVAQHPWVGIGFAGYERAVWMRTGSIDNFWLYLAVRFGLPATILMLITAVSAIYLLAKTQTYSTERGPRLHAGLLVSLTAFAILLLTVHAWFQSLVWFTMLLGLAAGISGAIMHESSATRLSGPKPSHEGKKSAGRPVLRKIPERRLR